MQLPQKQEIFSQFFFELLKSTLNFEHFPKKNNLIADLFPKLWAPKKLFKKMSKKTMFHRTLGQPEW